MNYYTDLPDYVSNSQLGQLQDLLSGKQEMAGLQQIYDFGNLVDAKKTEKHKFDTSTNTWTDEGGRSVIFDNQTIEKANLMVKALDADPVLEQILVKGALYQYVFMRARHRIDYEGDTVYLPMRMKCDILNKALNIVVDIKTTGCKTQESFNKSIEFFNYDRQGATYTDLSNVPRILYVGVSKHKNKKTGKHDVFKYLIEKGDKTYLAGHAKKNYLAYKFYYLIHSLSVN